MRLRFRSRITSSGVSSQAPTPALLLDLYPNATCAFSVSKLRNAYAGAAIRVRRDSDNAEQDIGFVNNELDTASLLAFVGAGSGFVAVWYDQSINSNDLVQNKALEQGIIVQSGVLREEGSKPAIYLSGTNGHLLFSTSVDVGSMFIVYKVIAQTAANYIVGREVSPPSLFFVAGTLSGINGVGVFDGTVKSATNNKTNYAVASFCWKGSNYDVSHNNSSVSSLPNSIKVNPANVLGRTATATTVKTNSNIQNLIIYPNDMSSDRAAIINNINNYFNVF